MPPLNLAGREGKLIQHAPDWGIGTRGAVPSGAARQMEAIVRHIHKGARQVRQGMWRNQVDDAIFYFNGKHIVVTKPDGTLITVLKNAKNNRWFNQADILIQK